jgi:hypothetical protein
VHGGGGDGGLDMTANNNKMDKKAAAFVYRYGIRHSAVSHLDTAAF